jgi:uncharacterized RDD family membrane protein YckC
MKAHNASLVNAILLIVLSLWGYLSSDSPSFTALIPAIAGVLLLFCYPGVKKENKIIAHIAVVITLLIAIGLVRPLTGAFGRNDAGAIFRVSLMLISSVVAMVYFVKSFIRARKGREAK